MKIFKKVIFIFIFTIFLGMYLLPLYWIFITAFKIEGEVLASPPIFLPIKFTLDSFKYIFLSRSMFLFLKNSLIISFFSVILSMVLGCFAAFSLAKFKFKKGINNFISNWILSTKFMPPIIIVLPVFFLFKYLGILDTRLCLIIAYTSFNLPFIIWMMKGYFSEIPSDIEEAGLIDGCGKLGVFFRIIIPLSLPGIAASGIFSFILSWNEFIFALILTSSRSTTLPVFISQFITDRGLLWGQISAASFIALIPVVIFAIFSQKYIVRGLTAGAVKG